MTTIDDLLERLDRAEARLAAHAADPAPGLTEPDARTGERWDAGQAWAHLAELVPYWHGQIRRVLEPGAIRPVSFGRVVTDPDRVAAIETGRHEAPREQMARLHAALADVRAYIGSLAEDDLVVTGTHPTLGEMDVRSIAQRFIAAHLEDHADQLDRLRASAAGT